MEKLFKNIVKSFLNPVNILPGLTIVLYFFGYITGNADASGMMVFGIAMVVANCFSGVFMTVSEHFRDKDFENRYMFNFKGKIHS